MLRFITVSGYKRRNLNPRSLASAFAVISFIFFQLATYGVLDQFLFIFDSFISYAAGTACLANGLGRIEDNKDDFFKIILLGFLLFGIGVISIDLLMSWHFKASLQAIACVDSFLFCLSSILVLVHSNEDE